jgi:hypothetical protein
MIIGSLGTWRGQAVQNSRLRLLKVREFRTDLGVRLRFTLLFAIDTASIRRGKQLGSEPTFGLLPLGRLAGPSLQGLSLQ